jgi:2'-hydroxyisoflavone reductase
VHARPMRLLVLGGTRFVGRAVIAEAIKRGWNVTALHRGVTGGMPPDVTVLYADRADNAALASSLGTGTWDIVVDTWSGAPRVATAAAELLAERADQYCYISSGSVYVWAPTSTKPPRSSKAARPARPATIPRSSAEPSLEY